MILAGHEDIIAALERDLPQVCLFTGPHSVGKWTVAEEFRQRRGALPADVLRVHQLKAEAVETIVRFVRTPPVGPAKVVIIQLDGARPAAQNALLKTLESPGQTQFFLVSERMPLPTVSSRAVVYRFGRLTKEQVVKVLIDKNGMREGDAGKYAELSDGQVIAATRMLDLASPRAVMMIAVRALRDRDLQKLESVAREWDEDCTRLLSEWCFEALSGRRRLFSEEELDLSKIGRRIPVQILGGMTTDIRPGLFVRAVLSPLLRGQ